MRQILTTFALSLTALRLFAGDASWVQVGDPIESFGNATFTAACTPVEGIRIRIATPDSRKSVQLAPESLTTRSTNRVVLVLKFRQEGWSLYHQDRCLAVIPPSFPFPVVVQQSASRPSSDDLAKPRFQKVADFRFEDSFMRPEETENPLGEWEPMVGEWYLHAPQALSIGGDAVNPSGKRSLKSDFSPNFYSLAGTGTPAVITAGYDFYDDYAVEAGVRVGLGEMGLLFYVRDSGAAHAFTLALGEHDEEALLTLWDRASSNSPRRILAAAAVKTSPGQWIKLRVQTLQNRVQCYMDQAKVFDLPVDLPASGKFGLYADSPEEVRFDDVTVGSNHDLEMATVGDLRRYVLEEHGAFLPRRRFYQRTPPGAAAAAMTPAVSRQPQWLALGATAHGPHVFEATFEPESLPFTVGVLAGYRSADEPHYRFTCSRTEAEELFVLEKVSPEAVTPMEAFRLPVKAGQPPPGGVTLTFDASREKEWRLYRNGVLVLVHVPAPSAAGASGLYVGENTRVRIAMPGYRFARSNLFVNRYEKNNRFAEDPFMRHWASPEGQWLAETNGLTWYTGDFFGRFSLRMPYVEASRIHLGVGEDSTNGEWLVSMQDDALFLHRDSSDANHAAPLARSPTNALAADESGKWYTIQNEGHWLWGTSGDALLFKQRLDRPIAGRRIRVDGFTTAQLKATFVERFNVKDFLFTESLFDWIVNGGRWEVVNRFQCDPRWSHMNGESTNGLAALWTKLEIGGDFCVEMHAGQRHGWYDRCGDMNLTVMNRDTTPSQGYSITCTGWDPDHSQLFTTLYRNGAIMTRSDKYLVPRKREGNKRLGYEPLVAAGRDVHGAWYYLKFRRIGKKLELFFDNELVFSAIDEQPLNGGSAGIWTFLNSMMVARVKVAAESIRFRDPEIRPVSLAAVEARAAQTSVPEGAAGPSAGLMNHGLPLCLTQPAYWEADDPVSGLRLEWHDAPGSAPFFAARNRMGSGNMLAACSLPPVPFPDLAGWRFEVKRTPDARFDFHFTAGRLKEDGGYAPERHFVYRLSGTGPLKGPGIPFEGSDVPPVPAAGALASDTFPWTTITVWLPRDWNTNPLNRNIGVRIEGFGLMHPSLDLQGLTGNAPGAAYAVRNFTEIRYAPPELTVSTNRPPPSVSGTLAALQAKIAAAAHDGLNDVSFEPRGTPAPAPVSLAWIRLPARPAIACTWHDRKPDTVVLRGEEAYPDPRFLQAAAWIGETNPVWVVEDFATRSAAVPRENAFCAERISVRVASPDVATNFFLAWKDNPIRDVPVLLGLRGLTPFLQNGETRDTLAGLPAANPSRLRLADNDPEQGRYFTVMNTLYPNRLRCALPATLSLARYPYFQFRYRTTDPMTRISMALGNSRVVQISEKYGAALPVRYATNLVMDAAWHTWMGQVSDAIGGETFSRSLFQSANPELGSASPIDQTGLFSEWDLDDLVFGPAVSSPDQLALTPDYFDFGGIASVHMAIGSGPEPYDTLTPSQRTALVWRAFTNGVAVVPRFDGLADGPHHLLLKARGQSGRESHVTDIPFLLDRQPLQVPAPSAPTSADLRVTWLSGGGAPLDLETFKLEWDGQEISHAMPDTRLLRNSESDTLSFNWAYYFRDQLSKTTNGQRATILLAGVQDGAGNRSPDVVVPVTIDYEKDRQPPSLLNARYPTNVFWRTTWDTAAEQTPGFSARSGLDVALIRGTNEAPYVRVTGTNGVILAIVSGTDWQVNAFPWLALRIRRPVLAETNTPAALSLILGFSTTNIVTVPLIGSSNGKKISPRQYSLPEPIEWRSNEWESVFIDLTEVVKDRIPTQSLAGLLVKSLSIRHTAPASAAQFHLQSVFAYAPGNPADRVKLDSYDISGLDALVVNYETPDGRLLDAASFFGATGVSDRPPRGWALLRTRDKAGNQARPVRVPVWSAHPPAGEM